MCWPQRRLVAKQGCSQDDDEIRLLEVKIDAGDPIPEACCP
jgi:hypothetical protein